MFERSKSGQQNRAAFLNVDYVCYVEGGGDASDETSKDVTFWAQVFIGLRPDLRVHFTPRGGKPILEKLAEEVISQDILNTLVAIDSDYDEVTGDRIIDRRVLYTFGYSWENDVLCLENIKLLYCALSHAAQCSAAVVGYLEAGLEALERELRLPVIADYFALRAGSSVLPREAPGRVVGHHPGAGLPKIRRSEVLKLCSEANVRTKPRIAVTGGASLEPSKHCVGHILSLAITYLVRAALQTHHRKRTLSPEHMQEIALQTFSRFLSVGDRQEVAMHHRRACAAI